MKQFLSLLSCFLLFYAFESQAQHDMIFPYKEGWNVVAENDTLSFKINSTTPNAYFFIKGSEGLNISFDHHGKFLWVPGFDLVDRVALKKDFSLVFGASFGDSVTIKKTITFTVKHTNRPPVVDELPMFYVKQASRNIYQFGSEYVHDPDGDPIVFKAIPSQMPEGASLNSGGQLEWMPSRSQFVALRANPVTLEFTVQDQPEKAETTGKLRIAQTQQDLPPEMLIVPGDSSFTIKEDATLNLKIYLSDPNGDDNVRSAGIIPSDNRIPETLLKQNTPVQYEFTWTPGYQFAELNQSVETMVTFFVLDKTNNRTQKRIRIMVTDAENLIEKDALQFNKYRNNLMAAMLLIAQLDANQKKLNQDYKKARKGKKNRSILNASLGAATGISPVTLEADQSKIVSGIGGTTVLTLGTLEATEVIGRSKEAILEKIKIGIEIRNRIQAQGDEFARKYSLKPIRRSAEFEKDIDKLRAVMNDQKLVLLELDASNANRQRVDNKEIKKVFIDFNEE